MIKCDSSKAVLNTVRATLKVHRMVRKGSRVVVGVSGGPDSVALLHVLNILATELHLWIIVAHLDHSLRPESNEDAEFVKRLTEESGLEFSGRKTAVRSVASDMGISIEEAGRRCRYIFFEEVRESVKADVIATAHHRDDELETFFLRVCRGSSLKGLCGIPAVRGRIIRPMIGLYRAQIVRFLQNEGIRYRIDPTNFETDTDRNFIRNRLVPVIAERFPGFRVTAVRTILTLRHEEDFIEELSSSLYSKAVIQRSNELIMDVHVLREAPAALVARAIMAALHNFSGPDVRWSQSNLDSILRVLRSNNPSATVVLPAGIRLFREYDVLKLARDKPENPLECHPIIVQGPGTIKIWGGHLILTFRVFDRGKESISYTSGSHNEFFDADKAAFPMVLRLSRPGDRIRPWGLDGTRKVKKMLIDMKVPVSVRRKLPLLVKGETIMWVPGIRRGHAAPIEDDTRRVLEVGFRGETSLVQTDNFG